MDLEEESNRTRFEYRAEIIGTTDVEGHLLP